MTKRLMPDDFYTTDTASTKDVASRAVSAWKLDGEPSLIGRLENFTYQAGPIGRERIIRVTEPSHRSVAELEAELDWVSFLSERGINVSAPTASDHGNLVETFETADGPFYVSVFPKAPGRAFNFRRDWEPEFHRALGELIGSMHAATIVYSPPEGARRRISWVDEIRDVGQFIPRNESVARREFDTVMDWAEGLPTGPDRYGLVHFDLHFANLFVDPPHTITVFDFDDCQYNWFASDLAVPILHALLSFELPSTDPSQQDWFYGPLLDGYTKHMPVDDEWPRRMPGFVRLRRVDLFAWICKLLDVDNLTDEWDVRAMRRIREGFNNREPLW